MTGAPSGMRTVLLDLTLDLAFLRFALRGLAFHRPMFGLGWLHFTLDLPFHGTRGDPRLFKFFPLSTGNFVHLVAAGVCEVSRPRTVAAPSVKISALMLCQSPCNATFQAGRSNWSV